MATEENVKSLYDEIDKCISELVIARGKRDEQGIADAHWRMESLMVKAQQMCSVILDSLQEEPVCVERIKAEVERLKGWNNNVRNSTRHMTLQEEDFNRGKHSSYLEILDFIDSLQEEPSIPDIVDEHFDEMLEEEPVSKVWHTTMEEPNGEDSIVIVYDNGCTVEPSFKDFKSYSEWGTIKQSYRVKLWAYLDVLLSLSSVERNGKNSKTMLDSSLSKMTKKDWNEFLDECESENPEKAAEEYVDKRLELVDPEFAKSNYKRHTKMGVRYFTGSDLEETYIDAANWQKKQMMKDAVALETEIYLEGGTTLQFKKGEIFLPDNKPKTSKFKAGDKVKLIIIKEE